MNVWSFNISSSPKGFPTVIPSEGDEGSFASSDLVGRDLLFSRQPELLWDFAMGILRVQEMLSASFLTAATSRSG
jgi:hypothetical protein